MTDNGIITVRLTLNGEQIEDNVPADLNLLEYLRDTRALRSVKSGCRIGYCGACTVVLDGALPAHTCCMLTGQVDGRRIETVDSATREVAALQDALARRNALQCGFCMPGIVMTGVAFLRAPRDTEALELLLGNICRCGAHSRIIGAFRDAATRLA